MGKNSGTRSVTRRLLFGVSLALGALAVAGVARFGRAIRQIYDDPVRFHFLHNRAAFQELCDRFPSLGVQAIGSVLAG